MISKANAGIAKGFFCHFDLGREGTRVPMAKKLLLGLLISGFCILGHTQRLYIVAPQGNLYLDLSTADHQYTYESYTMWFLNHFAMIPYKRISNSGWIAGTWRPLNYPLIPTGSRPFIWSPESSKQVVLTPQFPFSGCQWGESLRLDSSDRYLFFWTKQNWWDYDGIADPYILAYYSIDNRRFEFYRESVEPYSAWTTHYPLWHDRWGILLLGDGAITLHRYEGDQYYGTQHYHRYPSVWFPPGSPPRWSQQYSTRISLNVSRNNRYALRFTEDGSILFGTSMTGYYYPFSYFYVRRHVGSQNWEEIGSPGWAIPMAASVDNRYTLHNVQISINRTIATMVDWRTRQQITITPPSVGNMEPFAWAASAMSADGSYVVGRLYSVYDRRSGHIQEIHRAYIWKRGAGAQFIDSKYGEVIPFGYRGERWKVRDAVGISPNGRYILLEMLRPINVNNNLDYELVYGLLDTSGKILSPESIFVVYRNLTDPNRAYPYEGDQIELRVFVQSDNRHYTRADDHDITALSKVLARHRWLHTGTKARRYGGELKDLDPNGIVYRGMTTVLPWTYAKTDVRWFIGYPERYKVQGRHYTRYPQYTEVTQARNSWSWRPALLPGTYRIFVRVHWSGRSDEDWINADLYQPTPGEWRERRSDKAIANWTLLWSKNCDEEDELALRISVRARANWVTNPRRRAFVEWASSFLNVPYEWGGDWYGGRADNQPHTTDAGYGIDCSGLVCTAARMAGYNIPRINATMMLSDTHTQRVTAANLEPGDLIVMGRIDEDRPGHVWIVYRVNNRQRQDDGKWMVTVDLIQASGSDNRVINGSYYFIVENLLSDRVDTSSSLNGLGLSNRYREAVIRLRRLR